MELGSSINHMMHMEGFTPRIGPCQTINGNSIIEVQIILQGTWLGMLRQRALGAYRTPEVSGSLDHFWSESLLQHRGAHTLGTRMTHVLVDLCQHVLIFPGECLHRLMYIWSGRDINNWNHVYFRVIMVVILIEVSMGFICGGRIIENGLGLFICTGTFDFVGILFGWHLKIIGLDIWGDISWRCLHNRRNVRLGSDHGITVFSRIGSKDRYIDPTGM